MSLALLLLLAAPLQAGVLKGIALENQTSYPLARTTVSLQRLENGRLIPLDTIQSTRQGQFAFEQLPAGYYLLSATRPGFAQTRYGQRRNNAPGTPIFIAADAEQFVELRLKRFGVITGRALDENRVGLPGIPIIAYTNTTPMAIVSTATSDERGVYRLTGLQPGRYIVRTAAGDMAGTGLLPTYHPFNTILRREAQLVTADLDIETTNIDVQPAEGRLMSLAIRVLGCIGSAKITLSSDTGRTESAAECGGRAIAINGLAPGEYEVLAEGTDYRRRLAGFQQVQISRNQEIGVNLRQLGELKIQAPKDVKLVAQRTDLAGPDPQQKVLTETNQLPPGFYHILAEPQPGSYLTDVKTNERRQRKDPNPERYEIYLEYSTQATIDISPRAARLTGKAPIGAPVYLLPTTPLTRRQMNGPRITQADNTGMYHLESLAPGNYLLLTSYDISEITEEALLAAQARPITIEEGRSMTIDLQ